MKRKEKIKQLKNQSVSGLESRLKEVENKILNLGFDKNLKKVKDTTLFRKLRKERSQIKTFLSLQQKSAPKISENPPLLKENAKKS